MYIALIVTTDNLVPIAATVRSRGSGSSSSKHLLEMHHIVSRQQEQTRNMQIDHSSTLSQIHNALRLGLLTPEDKVKTVIVIFIIHQATQSTPPGFHI